MQLAGPVLDSIQSTPSGSQAWLLLRSPVSFSHPDFPYEEASIPPFLSLSYSPLACPANTARGTSSHWAALGCCSEHGYEAHAAVVEATWSLGSALLSNIIEILRNPSWFVSHGVEKKKEREAFFKCSLVCVDIIRDWLVHHHSK